MTFISHFINGRQVDSPGLRQADVFNPALGEPCASVALADREDVDAAVSASRAAFPAWAATPPLQRARVLFNYL